MGKKILMLSLQDNTASGYRMAESVGLNSNNFMEYIVLIDDFTGHNATKSPFIMRKKHRVVNSWDVSERVLNHAQGLVDNADIIHLKGDELPRKEDDRYNFYGLYLPKNTPSIVTVAGSFFRRGDNAVSMPKHEMSEYLDNFDIRTAITPDLNYDEFKGLYIPHTIDCKNTPNLWKARKVPVINHSKSGGKKGTKVFVAAIEILRAEGIEVDITFTSDVSHKEAMRQKAEATIFFDQVSECGWYAMSGIEALSMGIPTVAYLSDEAIRQGNCGNTAAINCGNTVESIVHTLRYLLTNYDLKKLSEKSYQYAKDTYSYEVIGKRWAEIYENM